MRLPRFAIAFALTACAGPGDLNLEPPPDASAPEHVPTTPPSPPNACGNRTIDPGEQCDDGNTVANDGCSPACALESGGAADLCHGAPISLVAEGTHYTGHVRGTTAGLFDHYGASCGGGSGADAVYRIDPPMSGRATVRLSAAFPSVLSLRTSCEDPQTELGCAEKGGLDFPVFQGAPVYILVDGYGGASGAFTFDVDIRAAICGNGIAEFPETCDDGNKTANDGCSATCTLEDIASPSTCPGMGYRLTSAVSFAGDTSTLENGAGFATGCGSSGVGRNAIYAITPTVTGTLALSLVADYQDALLHVRRDCPDNTTQADCRGGSEGPRNVEIPVVAEQTVYVFVDGDSARDEGPYTLDAKLAPAACGNGAVDGNEECDDGNHDDGDGCSSACIAEPDAVTFTCPGRAIDLASGTVTVRGTTAPAASKWSSCGSSSAPDVVYAVTSPIDGWFTAKVKGAFNTALAVRAECSGPDLSCAKGAGGTAQEEVSLAVTKNSLFYVVVDGQTSAQRGSFVLDLAVRPSVCGNFIVEGGETCDDGGTSAGDGCSPTCTLEPPSPHDACETAPFLTLETRKDGTIGTTLVTGNTNLTKKSGLTHSMSPCSSLWADGWFPFTAPIDGVMTARIASATFRSTIAVRTGCAPDGAQLDCDGTNAKGGQEIAFPVSQGTKYWIGVAGGFVESGRPEVGRFTLDVSLVPTGCGDAFVTAPEACDDGNVVNGDGCSATCALEPLANVSSCPGHSVSLNGTGTEVRRATVTVDTRTLPSNTASACGGSGPEGVLVVTPDIDGTLAIKSTAGHAVLLHARTTCNDPRTEIAKDDCSTSSLRSVTASVVKNTPYYVFVDGQNGAAGVTKLQITVSP